MSNKKYTFVEFMAACEGDDFDSPSQDNIDWAEQFVDAFPKIMKTEVHFGDCTNHAVSCNICIFETLLRDYRKYYFNEEEWRKENI